MTIPIVVCTVGSRSLSVFQTSAKVYNPDVPLIIFEGFMGNFGDDYNAAMEQTFRDYDEIIIANAYFLPGWRFRKALVEAAERGVKVKLLLQGRLEYFYMFASHAFYNQFLERGIEIFEYQKCAFANMGGA